ncbi:hypothetical protein MBM_01276 [Drepanopeziza brunnea f. sp. 'multigermtubi' MB_m1]|uniref:Uncharacterized protein n=1 Tax=Marssonina brunnea f. sp. multigermtubi (strain MB_m1) TaxID=1072389 RepID=K1Y5Y1_MARBU|nr:uncharacterized protein MBM_01276 [Drepanopeziza brunnea f. sp. 'multigermtubi' MB_m1]EKD20594.1 hypothetical protein MBM_01276 [Drepanopeziza brunnea f. sp. 'multigermtubi' MB_m1]
MSVQSSSPLSTHLTTRKKPLLSSAEFEKAARRDRAAKKRTASKKQRTFPPPRRPWISNDRIARLLTEAQAQHLSRPKEELEEQVKSELQNEWWLIVEDSLNLFWDRILCPGCCTICGAAGLAVNGQGQGAIDAWLENLGEEMEQCDLEVLTEEKVEKWDDALWDILNGITATRNGLCVAQAEFKAAAKAESERLKFEAQALKSTTAAETAVEELVEVDPLAEFQQFAATGSPTMQYRDSMEYEPEGYGEAADSEDERGDVFSNAKTVRRKRQKVLRCLEVIEVMPPIQEVDEGGLSPEEKWLVDELDDEERSENEETMPFFDENFKAGERFTSSAADQIPSNQLDEDETTEVEKATASTTLNSQNADSSAFRRITLVNVNSDSEKPDAISDVSKAGEMQRGRKRQRTEEPHIPIKQFKLDDPDSGQEDEDLELFFVTADTQKHSDVSRTRQSDAPLGDADVESLFAGSDGDGSDEDALFGAGHAAMDEELDIDVATFSDADDAAAYEEMKGQGDTIYRTIEESEDEGGGGDVESLFGGNDHDPMDIEDAWIDWEKEGHGAVKRVDREESEESEELTAADFGSSRRTRLQNFTYRNTNVGQRKKALGESWQGLVTLELRVGGKRGIKSGICNDVILPLDNPNVIEDFMNWLYHGPAALATVLKSRRVSDLVDLHLFADKYQCRNELKNVTMDAIQDVLCIGFIFNSKDTKSYRRNARRGD